MGELTLAVALKTQRKACGMALKAAAKRAAMTQFALTQYESGASLPSIDECKALAKLYGTSAAKLLDLRRRAQPVPYRQHGYTPQEDGMGGDGSVLAQLPARVAHGLDAIRYGSYEGSLPAAQVHHARHGLVHFHRYGG